MEFFNKKQDVLDIKLTGYGKQLLSRGIFKPVYYSFSDDGVMYDAKWMSGTLNQEQQSTTEPRIQENTPRLKTQYRKIGAERGIYGTQGIDLIKDIQDLFEVTDPLEILAALTKANLHPFFAESEKLLENVLGIKSYFNGYNPAWNVLLYHGLISSSTSYYKKNDITTLIPQINCTLIDTVYKLDSELDPFEVLPEANNILTGLEKSDFVDQLTMQQQIELDKALTTAADGDEEIEIEEGFTHDSPEEDYFEEFDLEDGKIFIIKDFIFLSVEEANSEFTNNNFSIEVFEVTTKTEADDGEEELIKMNFSHQDSFLGYFSVQDVFDIAVDNEINPQSACYLIGKDKKLKSQNIYNSNIFDCSTVTDEQLINSDPYSNLPSVDVGDVC